MERFFRSDNAVMRALSKLFDIGWLSILYILFCVPVVTVGAATTALYYVAAKVLRHDRSYVWTEFWHSFRQNFLPATVIWIIFAAVYGILYFNLNVVGISDAESEYGAYLAGAYLAIGFLAGCIMSYVFCVLSRFQMKVRQILRFSLYMAFRHFVHTFMLLAVLFVAGFGIYAGFVAQMPILLLFVPGTAAFLYTFPMEHALKKYMPKKEQKFTEDGEPILEWYEE